MSPLPDGGAWTYFKHLILRDLWYDLSFQLETEAQKGPESGPELPNEATSQAGLKDKDFHPGFLPQT